MATSKQPDDVLIVRRSDQEEGNGTDAYEVVAAQISDQSTYGRYAEARDVAERLARNAGVDVWYQPDQGRDELLLVAEFRGPEKA
jgi:hypothetical protein